MGLFSKEVREVKVIELSDETRQALISLDNDIQVLQELTGQVIVAGKLILQAMGNEVMELSGRDEISTASERLTKSGEPRTREAPFTRRPYSEQYDWVKSLIEDGEWYHPHNLAKEHATDDRHYRYLKSAINRMLGDMVKEGHVERKTSTERGSFYQYRWIG